MSISCIIFCFVFVVSFCNFFVFLFFTLVVYSFDWISSSYRSHHRSENLNLIVIGTIYAISNVYNIIHCIQTHTQSNDLYKLMLIITNTHRESLEVFTLCVCTSNVLNFSFISGTFLFLFSLRLLIASIPSVKWNY